MAPCATRERTDRLPPTILGRLDRGRNRRLVKEDPARNRGRPGVELTGGGAGFRWRRSRPSQTIPLVKLVRTGDPVSGQACQESAPGGGGAGQTVEANCLTSNVAGEEELASSTPTRRALDSEP